MRLGKYGILKQAEMDAIKHCMQAAGWLEDSPNGLNTVRDKPIEPSLVHIRKTLPLKFWIIIQKFSEILLIQKIK